MNASLYLLPLAAALLVALPAAAVEPVRVQFVSGDVRAIGADGSSRNIVKGDVLTPGERLVTGGNGLVQLRSEGQGVASLRANSDVKLPPGTEGLSLNVLSGQVRTVALPGNASAPPVRLSTPTGAVEMKQGDFTSAVPEGGPEAPGESFVKVNAGEVQVLGGGEKPLAVEPGKAVALGGDAVRQVARVDIPDAVLPPAPVAAPVADLPSKAAPTTVAPAVIAAVDARVPADLPKLPALPLAPTAGAPGLRPGVAALPADGGAASVPGAVQPPKLPDIRPVVGILQVDGGDPSINRALLNNPTAVTGRAGVGEQVVNLIDPTALRARQPTLTKTLEPTVTMVGNQAVPTLAPTTGVTIANNGLITRGVVLTTPTLPTMGAAPTTVTNLGNTSIDTLNPASAINARTVGPLNTPTLNLSTIRLR